MLASFPPYCTKILGNTQSIPCGFCFICRKICLRNPHTPIVRCCLRKIPSQDRVRQGGSKQGIMDIYGQGSGRSMARSKAGRFQRSLLKNSITFCQYQRQSLRKKAPIRTKKDLRQHRTNRTRTSCLHLFRHIAQKSSEIHKVFPAVFVSSAEKSACAIRTLRLCGVALSAGRSLSLPGGRPALSYVLCISSA